MEAEAEAAHLNVDTPKWECKCVQAKNAAKNGMGLTELLGSSAEEGYVCHICEAVWDNVGGKVERII